MIITSSPLWLEMSLGLLTGGIVLGALFGLYTWDMRRQARADAELHEPRHRAVEEPFPGLTPAPVEVIRPAQEEERTEERPVVGPVEHVEVADEPTVEGAIGTMAADESPEMADTAWRHEHDKAWTQLLVGWAARPEYLAEFGAGSLQLPEYRRLVLERTQDITDAAQLARLAAEAKAGAQ